ncbi:phytanoyl-CoA dioxygenase family protein [Amycolatopsis sp. H20-H5]|uniref:phytanoyl-CoA dioxygenase family protein n=1 Tax=Amycolatopsis sp. H20-H5 TaxID=3046309 RepID=UPI002DB80F69|nr:phytanoyl-CoA dioxygenase family protein [Amycolatopsis sp. H20-H5]MEC3979002.1 phytanoyl-CoA dioxygenase family protein [Amycolatopsis sp. H20-H5]
MLTADQLDEYWAKGYLLLPGLLSPSEIEVLREALSPLLDPAHEATLTNEGDHSVRLVYGVHQGSDAYRVLVRLPRVLEPARQLLDGDVYVHQTKVTLNTPQTGEGWPWHQDYAFWRTRDHLPTPRVLSAAVFLDDVTAVNGPLFLVPGSHRAAVPTTESGVLDRVDIADVCRENGIDVPQGPAGSVLYFDGNTVHGSSSNVSPFERRVLYITYNSVENAPSPTDDPPPDHLAARDRRAITVLADDALLAHS